MRHEVYMNIAKRMVLTITVIILKEGTVTTKYEYAVGRISWAKALCKQTFQRQEGSLGRRNIMNKGTKKSTEVQGMVKEQFCFRGW